MGKLPILFPQESLKIWKTKIGKLTIRGVPCPWGSPESPLDKAPGSRCGEGDYDMELVQPRICPPSVPRMFVPKSTLAKKTGCGRETSCSIFRKTHI